VNPVPYGDELALLVDDEDNRISIDLAICTAYRFGIPEEEAKKTAESMCLIVRENWEQLAKKYGLSRGQIEYMRPAFGECQRGSV
jgi:serine/threonine-protein kinase HipA